MPYCESDSLQELLIGTKWDSATSALASKTVKFATSKMNSFLSRRYDVDTLEDKVPPVPLLETICQWLATSYVYQFGSRGGKETLSRAKELREMAMECLVDIRDYKLDLTDASGSVITDLSNTAYQVLSNTSDYSTTFNEDDPLKWKVDDDKLDDIESERDS